MVIKGGSRGGAGKLAAHLLREDTNERVELLEMRGVTALQLEPGATLRCGLREMEAVSLGTRCAKSLYHASINTGPGEELTVAQKHRAVDRLEERLGLTGHARAVVEHEKHGRAHLHVVWSRIDLATLKAVHDGHNYRAHEEVARELEREFSHQRVQGAHVERDGKERPKRTPEPHEMQQADRTKIDPKKMTVEITALWRGTDSGKAFAAALGEAGYTLAKGDKRDFVIVDLAGSSHSLARRIDGAKAADVRARLADLDRDNFPTVDRAREMVRERLVEQQRKAAPEPSATRTAPIKPQRVAPIGRLRTMLEMERLNLSHPEALQRVERVAAP